jgi:uncharacterized protein
MYRMSDKPDKPGERNEFSNGHPLRFVVYLCGLFVIIGSATNIASWVFHVDGLVRMVANASYILALPGWVVVYVFGFSGVRDHALVIVFANVLAWSIWGFVFYLVLALRARLFDRLHERLKISDNKDCEVKSECIDHGRRAFVSKAAIGVTCVGGAVAPGYATLVEPWSIKVRRYTVPIKGLDSALSGLKMVQLADTHLGPRIPASFIEQAVELVIAQEPDLVILTGDHIHDGTSQIERAAELCSPLVSKASIGVVGVLGNHDWWGGGHKMSMSLQSHGIRMIDNDRVWIDANTKTLASESPNQGLAIVGLGDLDEDAIDRQRAFRGLDPLMPAIVLAHNPDTAELNMLTGNDAPRIDLMCSGHTHGGQVRIPFVGTPLVPSLYGSKYAGGLVAGPVFPVHVSRGVGMSLLPVRVGVPPEISVITLVRR